MGNVGPPSAYPLAEKMEEQGKEMWEADFRLVPMRRCGISAGSGCRGRVLCYYRRYAGTRLTLSSTRALAQLGPQCLEHGRDVTVCDASEGAVPQPGLTGLACTSLARLQCECCIFHHHHRHGEHTDFCGQ